MLSRHKKRTVKPLDKAEFDRMMGHVPGDPADPVDQDHRLELTLSLVAEPNDGSFGRIHGPKIAQIGNRPIPHRSRSAAAGAAALRVWKRQPSVKRTPPGSMSWGITSEMALSKVTSRP